ncbi:DnaB-like helicase C-terminal domain-containing protein [Pseudidiomarina aquimaris]|uniref:DnaB-like helicase C-terminal domain-containing protein n=1 Tax=Pseudidiomarina aquimaris TaxID=641841 RepID=UPI003A98664B
MKSQRYNGRINRFYDLDQMTAGLQPSRFSIVAAPIRVNHPAMNLCENIAMRADKLMLVFGLEMPSEQIDAYAVTQPC